MTPSGIDTAVSGILAMSVPRLTPQKPLSDLNNTCMDTLLFSGLSLVYVSAKLRTYE